MIIGWLKRRKERERQEKEERRRKAERRAAKLEEKRKELEAFVKVGDRFVCAGITYVCRRISASYESFNVYDGKLYPDSYKIDAVYNKKGALNIEQFDHSDLEMLKAENKR